MKGSLHLTSRAILFEPKDQLLPILRFKLSEAHLLRFIKGLESTKVKGLLSLPESFAEVEELLKRPEQLALNLLKEEDSRQSYLFQSKASAFRFSRLFEKELTQPPI